MARRIRTRMHTRRRFPIALTWLENRITPALDVGNTLATATSALLSHTQGPPFFVMTDYIGDGTNPDRDVDLFKINAQPGLRITAVTSRPGDGDKIDTYLRLFDGNGIELAKNDDYIGGYSRLSYTVQTGLFFFLGVSGKANTNYDATVDASGTNNIIGSGDKTKGSVILNIDVRGAATAWISQGPDTIANGQTEGIAGPPANPVVGAIKTVLSVPGNPNRLFIATVNGGVFRTDNAQNGAGPTWVALMDDQRSLSINSMAFDSADTTYNTVIAGIGRTGAAGRDGGELNGLLRTTDGGITWTSLGGRTPDGLPGPMTGDNIAGVAQRGSVILAGANYGVQSSGPLYGGTHPGLFRSIDGGKTFSNLAGAAGSGLPAGAGVYDLVGDPGNPARYYLASGAGMFRSEDTGKTWTNVTGIVAPPPGPLANLRNGNMRLAVHNSAGKNAVYVVESHSGSNNGSVWGSADMGQNWTAMTTIATGAQGRIHLSIATDPTSENLVYVGGTCQLGPFPNANGASDFSGLLFRGDASKIGMAGEWTTITNNNADPVGASPGTSPHADSRGLLIVPDFFGAGKSGLIDCNDGGIHVRSEPTKSTGVWTSLMGTGLSVTETYSIAYDPVNKLFMEGAQDTGTGEQTITAGKSWTETKGILNLDYGAFAIAIPDKVGAVNGTVSQNFTVSGIPGNVAVVEVTMSITHANVGDLVATLKSPGGVGITRTLFTNVGGAGANFVRTTLADHGTTGIAAGAAPFTGTFSAQQALSGFNGVNPNGAWTLTITDTAVGNAGSLTGFVLSINSASLNGDGGRVVVQRESPTSIWKYASSQQYGSLSRQQYDDKGAAVGVIQGVPLSIIGGGQIKTSNFAEAFVANQVQPAALAFAGSSAGTSPYSVYISDNRGATGIAVGGATFGVVNAIAYGGKIGATDNKDVLFVASGSNLYFGAQKALGGGKTTTDTLNAYANYPGGAANDVVLNSADWKTAYVIVGGNSVYEITGADNVGTAKFVNLTSDGLAETPPFRYTTGLSDAGVLRSISFLKGANSDVVLVSSDRGTFAMQTSARGVWSKIGHKLPNAPGFDLLYSLEGATELLGVGLLGRGVWSFANPSAEFDLASPTAAITLGQPNAKNGLLTFNVAFNENVIGVSRNTFKHSLTGAGAKGGSVVSVSGEGKDYVVTVDSGTGGTELELLLKPDAEFLANEIKITDVSGNKMGATTASAKYSIDRKVPTAAITFLPLTVGSSEYRFEVIYNDDTSIKVSTAKSKSDVIKVTGPGLNADATYVSMDDDTNDGKPRRVTYKISHPNGPWTSARNGNYTFTMNAGKVSDAAMPANFVAASLLGTLNVDIATSYVVDIFGAAANDTDDGKYGPGELSLREAINLTNSNKSVSEMITFNPSIFDVPRTITLSSALANITDSVIIRGTSAANVIVDGANNFRLFAVTGVNNGPTLDVTFDNLTFKNGKAANKSGGGAVFNFGNRVTISNSILTANQAFVGGAVFSKDGGTLVLRDCAVTGNIAVSGGGIDVDGGKFTIEGCMFSGNQATGAAGFLGRGGAILFRNTAAGGQLVMRNSTLSGNVAANDGGGVYLYKFIGRLVTTNTTVTNNTATIGKGGGIAADGGAITLTSAIVSGNAAAGGGPDISSPGTVPVNTSFSAIGSNAGIGDFKNDGNNLAFGAVLLLGPLADNGSPAPIRKSHLPTPGSPLITAGANPASLVFDQRGAGFPRQIAGFNPDIGAVEYQSDGHIRGRVFEDKDANLVFGATDAGLDKQTVYLDLNNNQILDIGATINSGAGSVGIVDDNTPAGKDFTVNVAALVGSLYDMTVKLDIAMAANAELQATLKAPNGTTITLFSNNVDNAKANFTTTVLDDGAAFVITDVANAKAPFTGSFRPQAALSAFRGLYGSQLNGAWTLHVTDNAAGNTATVNSWSLDMTTSEVFTLTNASGLYQFDNQPNGNHVVRTVVSDAYALLAPPGGGHAFTLPPSAAGRDFPEAKRHTISGLVYDDKNDNGARDSGEPVLDNVVVYLDMNRNGVLDVATEPNVVTDATGRFELMKVTPGGYQLRTEKKAGYTKITQPTGEVHLITMPLNGASTGNIFGQFKPDPAPQGVDLRRGAVDPNPGPNLIYLLTFDEPVSIPSALNFAVDKSPAVSFGSINVVSIGGGDIYQVNITGVTGSGTLRLDMVNSMGVVDSATQMVDNLPLYGETYLIGVYDPSPEVVDIQLVGADPIYGSSANFTVTFSEPVTTPTPSNFALAFGGTANGFLFGVSGGPTLFTVFVAGITGDGTMRLDMVNSNTVVDSASQLVQDVPVIGPTIAVLADGAPLITSINRNSANPATGPSADYLVTFSEPVFGLSAGNFSVSTTGTAIGGISSITGGPQAYTVTVGLGGNGSLRLDMSNSTGLFDSIGHPIFNVPFIGETYAVGFAAPPPTVTNVKIGDGTLQRSMITQLVVTFSDSSISFSGPVADAFSVTRNSAPPGLEQGGITGLVNISAVHAGNSVTITFNSSGPNPIFGVGGFGNLSLPDGRYTLTINASKVIGSGGSQLDGDANGVGGGDYVLASAPAPALPTNIYRFFGDVTGDGVVASNDFTGTGPAGFPPNIVGFRQVFGGTYFAFDYNGDGSVAASDFVQFRLRFGGMVP